ncbi:hypothetical protein [Polymorphobacter sp.]|uniref:hypothetical protein n=1 Tax=Polymorphobacter sp. TaxID=1909290 RepID=UPI003F7128B1
MACRRSGGIGGSGRAQQSWTAIFHICLFLLLITYPCFNRGVELVGSAAASLYLNIMPPIGAFGAEDQAEQDGDDMLANVGYAVPVQAVENSVYMKGKLSPIDPSGERYCRSSENTVVERLDVKDPDLSQAIVSNNGSIADRGAQAPGRTGRRLTTARR